MKRVKVLIASVLFCAMGYVGYTAHQKMAMSEAEEFMKANIEALTLGEPGGSGWLWEEDWVNCEFGGSITIHVSSAGFASGTYAYSTALKTSLDSHNVSYSYIPPQPGRKSYCPAGWSPCSAKDCR